MSPSLRKEEVPCTRSSRDLSVPPSHSFLTSIFLSYTVSVGSCFNPGIGQRTVIHIHTTMTLLYCFYSLVSVTQFSPPFFVRKRLPDEKVLDLIHKSHLIKSIERTVG